MFQSRDGKQNVHHPDLLSFTNAAANGCYLCDSLLSYVMKKSGSLENCMTMPYTYYVLETEREDIVIAAITVYLVGNGEEIATELPFRTIPKSHCPSPMINIRNRNQAALFRDASRAAQTWMNVCLTEHEQCKKHTQPHWYPTRLLQLGELKIKVILPAEEDDLGPYVALSYSWGSNPQFLRLTASNIQQLRTGIPYTDLPTAFQEAIQLIKCLSISYLWIDSLCIIQSGAGSTEDWCFEATRMQDIYSNCVLNISLSQAAHPMQSCLRESCLDAIPPFEIPTRKIFSGNDNANRSHIIVYRDYYQYTLYEQPLGRRAWALQEWLLAQRVLSFGLGQVFWDCPQLPSACEAFPCGTGNDKLYPFDHVDRTIPLSADEPTLKAAWNRIVE